MFFKFWSSNSFFNKLGFGESCETAPLPIQRSPQTPKALTRGSLVALGSRAVAVVVDPAEKLEVLVREFLKAADLANFVDGFSKTPVSLVSL